MGSIRHFPKRKRCTLNGDDDILEVSTTLPNLTDMSLDELRTTQDPAVLREVKRLQEEAATAAPVEPNIHFYDH